jgi:3-oxoacyl-[acyl-carrier protein] reductase
MSTESAGNPRTVLVTGAAGPGIGAACARRFAVDGFRVVLSDRSESRTRSVAAQLARETEAEIIPLILDVADEDSVKSGIESAGPIDVLINNAAVISRAALVETELTAWERVLRVCLTGPFLMMRACLPGMMERGSGCIVNISSIEAWTGPAAGTSSYAAAKAGLLGLTRAAASEAAPCNVRVNAIAPGAVPNAGAEEAMAAGHFDEVLRRTPMGRVASPGEIASVAAFLASPDSSFVTGEVVGVSGGLYYRP